MRLVQEENIVFMLFSSFLKFFINLFKIIFSIPKFIYICLYICILQIYKHIYINLFFYSFKFILFIFNKLNVEFNEKGVNSYVFFLLKK